MSADYTWTVRATEPLWGQDGGPAPTVFYVDAPGQAGYYGATLQLGMYFPSREEAERAVPLLRAAYEAGQRDQLRAVQAALGIKP